MRSSTVQSSHLTKKKLIHNKPTKDLPTFREEGLLLCNCTTLIHKQLTFLYIFNRIVVSDEGSERDHRVLCDGTEMAPKVKCRNSQAKESDLDDTLENNVYIVPKK